MVRPRIAVFIDAENISDRHWAQISGHFRDNSWVNTCQLFGDFSGGKLAGWLKLAREHSLEPIMQLSAGKNCADIAMTIAVMDVLHQARFEAICLVSSDQDFAPLVRRIRGAGYKVVGFGEDKTPQGLRIAYTEFHLLSVPSASQIKAVPTLPAPAQSPSKPPQTGNGTPKAKAPAPHPVQNAKPPAKAASGAH